MPGSPGSDVADDAAGRGEFSAELGGLRRRHRRDDRVDLGLRVAGEQPRDRVAQRTRFIRRVQPPRQRRTGRPQCVEQPPGGVERPKARQRGEGLAHRDDQLRLVVVVAVGPLPRVARDSGRLFAGESLLRLRLGGMGLDGEGGCRGQELQQVRQSCGAARRGALGREPCPERPSVGHQRRVSWVVAEPDLRLGVRCRSPPLQVGDEGAGPPGVIARLVHEGDQHGPSLTAPAGYPDCTMALHTKHPASAPADRPGARDDASPPAARVVHLRALHGAVRNGLGARHRPAADHLPDHRRGDPLRGPVVPRPPPRAVAPAARVRAGVRRVGDAVAAVVGLAADHRAHAAAAGHHDAPGALRRGRAHLARARARHRVGPQVGHRAVAAVRAVGVDLHPEARDARVRAAPGGRGSHRVLVAQQPLRGRAHPGDRRQRQPPRPAVPARDHRVRHPARRRRPEARPALGVDRTVGLPDDPRRLRDRVRRGLRRRGRAGHRAADAPSPTSPEIALPYYIGYLVVGVGGAITVWLLRDRLFARLRARLRSHRTRGHLAGRDRQGPGAADRRLGLRHTRGTLPIRPSTPGSPTTARP